jgi:enterochelin esterase-like enzyme
MMLAQPSHVHHLTQLPPVVTGVATRSGFLENPVLAGAVLVAAVLLIAGWVVAAVRRRRRRRARPRHLVARRVGLSVATVMLLLVGTGLAINSYAGYVPTPSGLVGLLSGKLGSSRAAAAEPGDLAAGQGSEVVMLTIGDPQLDVSPSKTYVYLPPGYGDPANARTRYPVVYLIHGYPGVSSDWLRAGRSQQIADLMIARRLIPPMILVFPDVNGHGIHDSECVNAVHGHQEETYLTHTVPALIDRTFRTIADRSGRAVGGVSSGGTCALNLGLRHQDTYSLILSLAPYGNPGSNLVRTLFGGSWRLYEESSPALYIPTMRFQRLMSVFLDVGTADHGGMAIVRLLTRELTARGQYVTTRNEPGQGHTWRLARAALPYALVVAGQQLAGANPGSGRLLQVGASVAGHARRSSVSATSAAGPRAPVCAAAPAASSVGPTGVARRSPVRRCPGSASAPASPPARR